MLRRLFQKLVPPAEIDWTRQEIQAQVIALKVLEPGRSELLERLGSRLGDVDTILYSIKMDGHTPKSLAAVLITNEIGTLLESGRFHMHRGVLSGVGESLLSAWMLASAALVTLGRVSREEVDLEFQSLRKDIGFAG
jgi:hypothetical protein